MLFREPKKERKKIVCKVIRDCWTYLYSTCIIVSTSVAGFGSEIFLLDPDLIYYSGIL
jgi:hypothetical protein